MEEVRVRRLLIGLEHPAVRITTNPATKSKVGDIHIRKYKGLLLSASQLPLVAVMVAYQSKLANPFLIKYVYWLTL